MLQTPQSTRIRSDQGGPSRTSLESILLNKLTKFPDDFIFKDENWVMDVNLQLQHKQLIFLYCIKLNKKKQIFLAESKERH